MTRLLPKNSIPGREALGEARKRHELLTRARDALTRADYPVPDDLIEEIRALTHKTIVIDIPCLICSKPVRYAVRVMSGMWPRAAVCATCTSDDPHDQTDPEAIVI